LYEPVVEKEVRCFRQQDSVQVLIHKLREGRTHVEPGIDSARSPRAMLGNEA
jgi:hypothetical protein